MLIILGNWYLLHTMNGFRHNKIDEMIELALTLEIIQVCHFSLQIKEKWR